jgi:hypothetical protein
MKRHCGRPFVMAAQISSIWAPRPVLVVPGSLIKKAVADGT